MDYIGLDQKWWLNSIDTSKEDFMDQLVTWFSSTDIEAK